MYLGAESQGNIYIDPPHRASNIATPGETRCNNSNKPNSIFVSEHCPRCDRFSTQMRPFLLPDAVVSPPRCDRISTQTRSCLLPDSLKSIGLELRRIVRSTSTDVARERWQGILLKPTVLIIQLSTGFKGALLPSSFGCPVALLLKKRFISIPFVNTLTKCWENVA